MKTRAHRAFSRRLAGAALVLAMLIAALAASVAIALAADQQRWFAGVAGRRDAVQAQALALAGIQWARQIMRDDARAGTLDHLGEPWAFPLPPTPIENGAIEGRIEDAQGRINVNNIVSVNTLGATELARLVRLWSRFAVPLTTLPAIADWLDADGVPRASGAEDPTYAQALSTVLTANAPLVRTGELTAVHGFGSLHFTRLAPFIAALPVGTTLNVNTALPEVLSAAVAGLDGDALATFIVERERKPFTTVAEFRARLPRGLTFDNESAFGTSSSFFLVTVRARQGLAVAQARALLKRGGRDWPAVVWQTLE
ncbi:MAG: type II secretion system minor pseudopilin GspK [Casimicrobiaceae bacterium]